MFVVVLMAQLLESSVVYLKLLILYAVTISLLGIINARAP